MADKLNVIALISGGKDSIFSLLHCIASGHKIVALANLHPQLPTPRVTGLDDDGCVHDGAQEINGIRQGTHTQDADRLYEDSRVLQDADLNSFMYQTVGHTVVPLFAAATGLPLYRQAITGSAVNTALTYAPFSSRAPNSTSVQQDEQDETDSLIPLLRKVLAAHPEANAVSAGAILSTYQRTRIEWVAQQLGLIPLAFLWQYPCLPPCEPASLLRDMQAVGIEARIIKVASGGLDEGFLWENITSGRGIARVERGAGRFGNLGDGTVLGEGGEYETLVVDGPEPLFRERIVVGEKARRIVREGGGSAWLAIEGATVEAKELAKESLKLRIPDLLDARFSAVLHNVRRQETNGSEQTIESSLTRVKAVRLRPTAVTTEQNRNTSSSTMSSTIYAWTVLALNSHETIDGEATEIMQQIGTLLVDHDLVATDIIHTTILLRDMSDFITLNNIYGSLFTQPNPPSRVTIACGDALQHHCNVVIHLDVSRTQLRSESESKRKSLHVQSRSYWAPANIGPYSQAQSLPLFAGNSVHVVYIAGQIPLIPATMQLPTVRDIAAYTPASKSTEDIDTMIPSPSGAAGFLFNTCLALQHLHRIAVEMNVEYFNGAVAYLSRVPDTTDLPLRMQSASRMWRGLYGEKLCASKRRADGQAANSENEEDEDSPPRDLWEERHRGAYNTLPTPTPRRHLPDWSCIRSPSGYVPPCFFAEVHSLPRGADIEWQALLGIVNASVEVEVLGRNHGQLIHRIVVRERDGTGHEEEVDRIEAGRVYEICFSYGESLENGVENSAVNGQCWDFRWVNVGVVKDKTSINLKRTVPCYGLWDADGARLREVMVFSYSLI